MYIHMNSQDLRRQRMSLSAFIELLDTSHTFIFTKYSEFEATLYSQGRKHDVHFRQKILENKAIELEKALKNFHDSIEFSASLPLVVVPFLLPLLASLKDALVLIACITQSFTEPSMHSETYKKIQEKAKTLKSTCGNIISQTEFLIHRAKFREKSQQKFPHLF